MKLVSLLLGFFSFTLALESETSGALLQESEEATAGASSIEYGIIKLVDRGRLTPFGRTYDIYLDTDGRVPSFLHAGRSWICDPDNDDGPFDTLGKENKDAWIEIENVEGKDPLWFNYGSTTNPLSDVRTNGMDEWYYDYDLDWWLCQLDNPLQRSYFQPRVPTRWVQPDCCPKRVADLSALDYFWADTWMLQEGVGIVSLPNNDPITPRVYQKDADWIMPNADGTPKPMRELRKDAIDEITDTYRCPPTPGQTDSAVLIDFQDSGTTDWSSDEFPGQFRIMRLTGDIDRISMRFYITYEDLGGALPGQTTCDEGVNRQDYALATFNQISDTCPTDLDEDGRTGFNDLVIVLNDISQNKYYGNNGFLALTTVLSNWGDCQ